MNDILKTELIGKHWKELSSEVQEKLLKNANTIDESTGNNVENGGCMVYFMGGLIATNGRVRNGKIAICNNAVIYKCNYI